MIDACNGETLRRRSRKAVRGLLSFCAIVMLAACTGDNNAGSSADFEMTLSGSVGDGPIVNADVFVSDANGEILQRTTSDSTANYQVTVPITTPLPLRVTAVGGMDLVTGRAADFPLIAVVVNPEQTTVNMSPLSTLAVALAERSPDGVTEQSLTVARDTMARALSMGLDPNAINPMYADITEANIAPVVLANEALGETLRRTHTALLGTDAEATLDQLLGLIADDLFDGAIDASVVDPRVAVTFHAARAAVLLETAAGALHVDGADATTLMNTSIRDVLPADTNAPSVTGVAVSDALMNEARTSLAVLGQLAEDPWIDEMVQQLDRADATELRAILATELTPQAMVDLAGLPTQASLADDAALAQAAAAARDLTATPPPTLSLAADPESVVAGGTARLSWASADATFCQASGDWSGEQPINGTFLTDPLDTSASFSLTCTGLGGTTAAQANVLVDGAPPAEPPVVTLSSAATVVTAGDAVSLTWTTTAADTCVASGDWSGAKTPNGSETTAPLATDSTFALTCTGPGGSDTAAVAISVNAPTPAPTLTLNASPTGIMAGEMTTLSWNARNASSCTASGNWAGNRVTSGTEPAGPLSTDASYTMRCDGPGGSVSRTVSVDVQPPPAPSINFTASATTVTSGDAVTLSWSSSNASSCAAGGGWNGDKSPSGSETVGPLTSDTSFTLTCMGPGGNGARTVNVVVDTPSAPVVSFSVSSPSINYADSTTLSWSADNADSCLANGNWNGQKATSGSESVGPLTSTASYGLTCSGPGGSTSRSITVEVGAPPAPTLTFAAGEARINSGETTGLSWSSQNTDSCTASGAWSGTKATAGSETVGPLTSDAAFMMTCSGVGGSISRSVSIDVIEIPPPSITFSTSTPSISEGASASLSWSATTANSCIASGGWSGNKAVSGTDNIGPLAIDTSFTLTCTGTGGTSSESLTVTVTPAPAPSVALDALPKSIQQGDSTTLTWSSADAATCTASGGWSGSKATSGNETVGPLTSDASFTLTCDGPGGTANNSVNVIVTALPASVSINATPASIAYGDTSQVSWTANNVDSCTASGAWSGQRAPSGTESVGPLSADATFSLTCTGSGGSASDSASVVVAAPPSPTLTLSATPGSIEEGDSTALSWSATNVDTCTAQGAWSGEKATSGSEQVGPLTSDTTFGLFCEGAGGSVTRSANISVTPPAQPTVSLSAGAGSVTPGSSTTLDWSSDGVDTCTASGGWTGTKATTGSESVGPINADATFSLNCSGALGSAVAMTSVQVRTARLSWDAPTQNVDGSDLSDLAGFVVYYGNSSRNYTETADINDPGQTETVLNLAPGTWYFAVTAKDSDDNESAYSGEVSKTINN